MKFPTVFVLCMTHVVLPILRRLKTKDQHTSKVFSQGQTTPISHENSDQQSNIFQRQRTLSLQSPSKLHPRYDSFPSESAMPHHASILPLDWRPHRFRRGSPSGHQLHLLAMLLPQRKPPSSWRNVFRGWLAIITSS